MPITVDFVTHVLTVPDLVLTGCVGAGLTLAGAVWADYRNSKRQRVQHAFDAEQNEIEQKRELRKDVYLPVAESLSKLQAAIGNLAFATSTDVASAALAEFTAAIGKMTLISDTDTVVKCSRMVTWYTGIYLETIAESSLVRAFKEHAEKERNARQEAREAVERAKQEYNDFVGESRMTAHREASRLNILVQDSIAQLAKAEASLEAAMNEASEAEMKCAMSTLQRVIPANEHSFPLIVALRTELGVKTDERVLAAALDGSRDAAVEKLKELLSLEEKA